MAEPSPSYTWSFSSGDFENRPSAVDRAQILTSFLKANQKVLAKKELRQLKRMIIAALEEGVK